MPPPIKILIIDDAPEMSRFYVHALTKAGFQVLVAESAMKGILKIQGENPSVVLMDLQLPDRSGMEVLKFIRSHDETKNIPVVMFSGSATKQVIEEAIALGANAFVLKGMITVKQMVDKITALLPPSPLNEGGKSQTVA